MPSLRHSSAMLHSPRSPSSTILIFSSAEYCRRVALRMSRIAFSALSFFFVIIVPLQGNDESNVSLIQTAWLVRLLLTAHSHEQCSSPDCKFRRTRDLGEPRGPGLVHVVRKQEPHFQLADHDRRVRDRRTGYR